MTRAGLYDPELCMVEPMTPDSGYKLAKAMLSKPNPPKILITCNDNMALGAYRAIHEMGLRISKISRSPASTTSRSRSFSGRRFPR